MRIKVLSIVLILAFVMAACVPTADPTSAPASQPTDVPAVEVTPTDASVEVTLQEITVDAADYSFTAPETVTAGWVRVILTNSGNEPHHVQFLLLNDGVTVEQFEETLKQGDGPALGLTTEVGGVGAVHPGGTASAIIKLPEGEYVILCLIPSPSDGAAHHAKGMIKPMTVEAGTETASEPQADLTVNLKDFSFDMPDSLPVGKTTIKVTNEGPEPHELNILKLEDGKTTEDVMAFLSGMTDGPPPFAPVGGANGIDVGLTEYAELDLTEGTYVAICNIHSPKAEGNQHFTLGMIKKFTVGDTASGTFPVGRFVKEGRTNYGFTFNEDGTFHLFEGDIIYINATYKVEEDTFTETSNNGGCETNVSFTYAFDGKHLTFNYVGDPADDLACDQRYKDFNGVTYTLD